MSLHRILAPRNVAVIGASHDPMKVGGIVLSNLLQGGYEGPVYPINSRHETVQGLKCYRAIGEVRAPVDLAILCTPAPTVPSLVSECGVVGVGGLIVISAGFREVGSVGRALEQELQTAVRKYPQMRLIGPNCLGAIVPGSKLNASFANNMPAGGRVAFVSQSGALCTAVLDWSRDKGLGFSCFVSIGNAANVGIADLLDYLAGDPHTEAIILYIESIDNARAFMSAARACSRAKPIVAYKAGRFPESAKAAASHTGAMAGVDAVYEAAFARAGIVRVLDIKELFECAEILASGTRIRGQRLAIVTNAGGPGVMACDALLARSGKLARLGPETLDQLNKLLPAAWSHGNPVDILGDATPQRFGGALDAVLRDDGVDTALAILTPQAMTNPTETARAVAEVAGRSTKPVIASWMGAESVREGTDVLHQAGVPTADSPAEAIQAMLNLANYSRNLEVLHETPREFSSHPDRESMRASLGHYFRMGRDVLYEAEAKACLKAYGIAVTEPREAHSADEAAALARQIGFPVVLKVISPQITHKTDVGGVELSLSDEGQVRVAYSRMFACVRENAPAATISAVSVQPMITRAGGLELILGARKDPVFGPVIMVGLGGIAAELYQDRALGLPPLNERLAMHMLESLRTWPLIKGFRGRTAVVNIDRLVDVVLRLSSLVSDFPEIQELDANPVLIRDEDVIVLDARLVVDRAAATQSPSAAYSHLAIRPYPTELAETAVLPNGWQVTLRPIKPEDEPLWHALLQTCSRETFWSRFRYLFDSDQHNAAIRFCFVDYDRELTVVAEQNVNGRRQLLGVARVVNDANTRRAEFAILVGDPWQGKGLGRLMMEYCLRHIDRSQIGEVYGDTARDNVRMIRLFKRFEFSLNPSSDPALLRATRSLGSTR